MMDLMAWLEIVTEWISIVLLIIGAFLMLVAAIGIWRMPDIFLRLAATSKAATMGGACILLALAVHFFTLGIVTRALVTILFLFITAPVAAHMIGRAAYTTGCPLWEGTVIDELRGRYDRRTHRLAGLRRTQKLRE